MNQVFDATIENISTRRDNTLKLVIGTQEVSNEAGAKLLSLRNKYVKVLISDESINQKQIDAVSETKIQAVSGKSPSQRLRAVLFRLYESTAKNSVNNFEDFYSYEIEQMISEVKLKIDELDYRTQ